MQSLLGTLYIKGFLPYQLVCRISSINSSTSLLILFACFLHSFCLGFVGLGSVDGCPSCHSTKLKWKVASQPVETALLRVKHLRFLKLQAGQNRASGAYLGNFFPQTFLQKAIDTWPNSQLLQGTVAAEASGKPRCLRPDCCTNAMRWCFLFSICLIRWSWSRVETVESCNVEIMDSENLSSICRRFSCGFPEHCGFVCRVAENILLVFLVMKPPSEADSSQLTGNHNEIFSPPYLPNSTQPSRSGSLCTLMFDPFGNALEWLKVSVWGEWGLGRLLLLLLGFKCSGLNRYLSRWLDTLRPCFLPKNTKTFRYQVPKMEVLNLITAILGVGFPLHKPYIQLT